VDTNDYDVLIAPIKRRMASAVWRLVRDRHETEDVVQEVLVHVVRRIDRIREHRNPTALILRMCVHASLDHLRKKRRAGRFLARWREGALSRPASDPPARMAAAELRDALLRALSFLPKREGEAIVLHAVEGLDYPDTAEAMRCRESTVRVLVSKARRRLRERFVDSAAFAEMECQSDE